MLRVRPRAAKRMKKATDSGMIALVIGIVVLLAFSLMIVLFVFPDDKSIDDNFLHSQNKLSIVLTDEVFILPKFIFSIDMVINIVYNNAAVGGRSIIRLHNSIKRTYCNCTTEWISQ